MIWHQGLVEQLIQRALKEKNMCCLKASSPSSTDISKVMNAGFLVLNVV